MNDNQHRGGCVRVLKVVGPVLVLLMFGAMSLAHRLAGIFAR